MQKSDDLEDMENLREEKNNERGRGKKKTEGEEERLRGTVERRSSDN